jgi:hypothetical protein
VNGFDLWQAARSEYARTYISPTEFTLNSTTGWLDIRDVRIGIVSGADIVRLYERYGEGIFYENIRSFLGLERNSDRETVNRRILATIRDTPNEFLARNNGVTIRASAIETLEDGAAQPLRKLGHLRGVGSRISSAIHILRRPRSRHVHRRVPP